MKILKYPGKRRIPSVPPAAHPYQLAISASSGAGKSTLLGLLRKELGETFSFVSGGDMFRARAHELRFPTVREFGAHADAHPEEEHDYWCDCSLRDSVAAARCVVIESRLAHHIARGAFKVRLECPLHVRAERNARKTRRAFESALTELLGRDLDDMERFEGLYRDIDRPVQPDLVINTAGYTPGEIVRLILVAWQERIKRIGAQPILLK